MVFRRFAGFLVPRFLGLLVPGSLGSLVSWSLVPLIVFVFVMFSNSCIAAHHDKG